MEIVWHSTSLYDFKLSVMSVRCHGYCASMLVPLLFTWCIICCARVSSKLNTDVTVKFKSYGLHCVVGIREKVDMFTSFVLHTPTLVSIRHLSSKRDMLV